MDTVKMISEIKTTCSTLERKKSELMARVKEIDEKLSYYNMAIQGLEKATPKTDQEQQKRTWSRKPVMIEYNGVKQSITAWAKQLGHSPYAIRLRMQNGWPIEKVLSPEKFSAKKKNNNKIAPHKVFAYDAKGNVIRQFVGIGEASRELNLPVTTIEKIINKMTKEDQLRVRNYYLAYVL